jgi:molybdopterin converting factor small subunit
MATVRIPTQLRDYCGGAAELDVPASTVRLALAELERRQPSLYRNVCDETGAVRRHVNLFVNEFHVRDRNELETILTSGDILTILPAVSGG